MNEGSGVLKVRERIYTVTVLIYVVFWYLGCFRMDFRVTVIAVLSFSYKSSRRVA